MIVLFLHVIHYFLLIIILITIIELLVLILDSILVHLRIYCLLLLKHDLFNHLLHILQAVHVVWIPHYILYSSHIHIRGLKHLLALHVQRPVLGLSL
jgi:hypothetical protein